jgi:predicted PurR-regulated permease PerM
MHVKDMSFIFSEKIRERIESNEWDREIASRVLSAIRKKRKRMVAASLTSLATAAMILLAFIFVLNSPSTPDKIDQFITSQLDGTFNSVFNKGYRESLASLLSSQTPPDDDIDILIDETLTMR